jgi:DNA-binding response OmpR family regulator
MSRPVRIFLAEDNPGDVELVRVALREHNIENELVLAKDATEANRYLRDMGTEPDNPNPDCILLDLNLPNITGYELLQRFRRHPGSKDTPVIIVTSSGAEHDRIRAKQLGATRYFRKPSDLIEFLELGAMVRDVVRLDGDGSVSGAEPVS